jgi:hypothetical protein
MTNRIWDWIIFVVITYAVFTSAYQIALAPLVEEGELEDDVEIPDYRIDNVITTFFIIDMLMEFLVVPPEEPTFRHMDIAKKYIKGSFIIDALASFPFYLVLPYHQAAWFKLLWFPKIMKVFKLIEYDRFVGFFNVCCRQQTWKRKELALFRIRTIAEF